MSESTEIRAAAAANAAFYEAFAAGDAAAMEALWSRTASVLCIHPGASPLHGRDAVMESWRSILEAPPAILATDARVAVIRGVAFVTCLEHIDDAALAATNVFVWEDGAWRIVHHQAGLVQTRAWSASAPDGPLH